MILTFSLGSSVVKPNNYNFNNKLARFKAFSESTNFLVASTVQDEYYRAAVALGIPIVSPAMLSVLTEATNPEDIVNEASRHRLPRFKGTLIYLHLDESLSENRQIRHEIMANGGVLVSNITQATHVLVSASHQNDLPATVTNSQYVVSTRWLNESHDLGWCANEKIFLVRKAPLCRRSARRRLTLKGYIRGQGHRDSAIKYKRYQLCQELYRTETRCWQMMEFLLRISNTTENFLTEQQNLIIFGSLVAMKEIHLELVEKIGHVLDKWDDDSMIGNIFVELAGDLERAYLPYFQQLEICLETYKECKIRNSRFRSFIEVKEQDRLLDKQKIDYLFSLPYQQLTSRVLVTLKEIQQKTDKSSSDFICLQSAIEAVDQILRKCNDCKKKTSESGLIYKELKDVPAHVVCSHGVYIAQYTFSCVLPDQENQMAQLIQLYLFDDSLIIARKLTRSLSCVSLQILGNTRECKKAEFIDVYALSAIREIFLLYEGPSKAFALTLRSVQDTQWYLDVIDSLEESIDFMNKVVEQVNRICINRRLDISVGDVKSEVSRREWLERRMRRSQSQSPARTLQSLRKSIRRTFSFNSRPNRGPLRQLFHNTSSSSSSEGYVNSNSTLIFTKKWLPDSDNEEASSHEGKLESDSRAMVQINSKYD